MVHRGDGLTGHNKEIDKMDEMTEKYGKTKDYNKFKLLLWQ